MKGEVLVQSTPEEVEPKVEASAGITERLEDVEQTEESVADNVKAVKAEPERLNVLERDLKWGQNVWSSLLKTWGRVPLMDEETK